MEHLMWLRGSGSSRLQCGWRALGVKLKRMINKTKLILNQLTGVRVSSFMFQLIVKVQTLSRGQVLVQRFQRDPRRRDGQMHSQVLQVYGQSQIQQVHLQAN